MAELLHEMNCATCRSGEPALSESEIYQLQPQIPKWHVREIDRIKRLERTFSFNSFDQSLEFTNAIATLAKEQNHHPEISMDYVTVRLVLWTHKVRGLHKNDFILAAKIDRLARI